MSFVAINSNVWLRPRGANLAWYPRNSATSDSSTPVTMLSGRGNLLSIESKAFTRLVPRVRLNLRLVGLIELYNVKK